jgi:hypothetical protein
MNFVDGQTVLVQFFPYIQRVLCLYQTNVSLYFSVVMRTAGAGPSAYFRVSTSAVTINSIFCPHTDFCVSF